MEAFKLAEAKNLSTKVCSVTRDSKRDQLIVVVEVSQPVKGAEPRSSVDYWFYDDRATAQINEVILESKAKSILDFLGLSGVVEKDITIAPVEVPEDAKPEPAKKKTTTKKAAAKKTTTTKKKAPLKAVETAKEPEEDIDTDFDDLDDPKTEPSLVTYDKSKMEHKDYFRPIVLKVLGDNWRDDNEKKNKVRKAMNELNGKVAVTDDKGNVLASFEETAERLLA